MVKKELKYAIQKHDATNLHYDLRLEWKGKLLSWAIPKKPSNKEKRLAIQTPDHNLDYIDFEGKIPEGQYGAGTVKIWDKGTWVPIKKEKDKIIAEIKGKKLKGQYTLIKFKKEKQWLFFKIQNKP